MELMPWRPFGQLGLFRGDTDKLLDRLFNEKPLNKAFLKVKADFDKGVLKITLPKAEENKKKNIEISVH